jgi:hypothetical protein
MAYRGGSNGGASQAADGSAADGALAGGVAGCHRQNESVGRNCHNDILHGNVLFLAAADRRVHQSLTLRFSPKLVTI